MCGDAYGYNVASATMQVGTASAVLQTSVDVCAAREAQLFRLFVESNAGTTEEVALGFCNGGTFPVFLQSNGAQATAASFIAGVTYLFSFDALSRKFFLVGF